MSQSLISLAADLKYNHPSTGNTKKQPQLACIDIKPVLIRSWCCKWVQRGFSPSSLNLVLLTELALSKVPKTTVLEEQG
jgi:hypothetical protein